MRPNVWLLASFILAIPLASYAQHDGRRAQAVNNAVVHFGQPQPQTPDAAPPAGAGAAVTHFLMPDEVTIAKRGTVTFVVNGGGHGIAIHPVAKNTTRDDIADDLCVGAAAADPDPIVDRRNRFPSCNNTVPTTVDVNGTPVVVTGTQNLDYSITDGKDKLIIHTGFNLTAANSDPDTIIDNPRVDDATHGRRLLATSGAIPGVEAPNLNANRAGGFLAGSAFVAGPPAAITPGNRVEVMFEKTGRYLVICMNRGHSLNDHMFGFVNVVDDDDHDRD